MSLEQDLTFEIRKTKIQTAVLNSLKVSGILAAGLLAPHVVGVYFKVFGRPLRTDNVRSVAARLAKKGFIQFEKTSRGTCVRLTSKGQRYVARIENLDFKLKKPKRWDKKWRVVIFDIPEKRKKLRGLLRDTLTRIGFVRLQDSVWIYPYDCEELITLLKADFKVGKDVLYMIVDKIENDKKFRLQFDLTT